MYGHDAISGFFFFFFSSCLLSELFPFKPQRWTSSAKGTVWKAFYFLFSSQIYSQIFFLLLNIIHPIEASEQESSSKTGQILDHRQHWCLYREMLLVDGCVAKETTTEPDLCFSGVYEIKATRQTKRWHGNNNLFFFSFFFWANQPSLVMRRVAVL